MATASASSKIYMKQLEDMGDMPDYRGIIAEAYDKPVTRGVVNRIADVESQYLPTIFDAFAKTGTGTRDMSPAAKLSMIGGNLGRLTSQANAGGNVLNFFGNTVNDLANRAAQDWMNRQQRLMFLASQAQSAEQAAAARAASGAGMANFERLRELLGQKGAQGAGTATIQVPEGGFKTVQELNAFRATRGLDPVSQDYFANTYLPQKVPMPTIWDMFTKAVQNRQSNPGVYLFGHKIF